MTYLSVVSLVSTTWVKQDDKNDIVKREDYLMKE
jgi:hypothetical protein